MKVLTSIIFVKDYLKKIINQYWILFFLMGVIGLWIFYIGLVNDNSYDGLWYHKAAVVRSLNPEIYYAWLKPSEVLNPYSDTEWLLSHYPLLWYEFSTVIVSVTGKIHDASLVNLFALCLAIYFFLSATIYLEVSKWWALVLATCLAFNPVAVAQWHTSCVDGAAYYIGLAAISSGLIAWKTKGAGGVYSSIVLAFLALAIKLNMAVIVIGIMALLLITSAFNWRRFIFLSIFGLIVLWYPYVDHLIEYGNPFYPFNDQKLPSVIWGQVNNVFLEQSFFYRFWYSISSLPINNSWDMPSPFLYGWHQINWVVMSATDVRFGGFGPWFSWLLGASFVILIAGMRNLNQERRQLSRLLMVGTILFLGVALFHPAGWWARFTPYLWMIPCFCLLPWLSPEPRRGGWVIKLGLISLLSWIVFLGYQIHKQRMIQHHALQAELQQIVPESTYHLEAHDLAGRLSNYHHGPVISFIFKERGAFLSPQPGVCRDSDAIRLPMGHRACLSQ